METKRYLHPKGYRILVRPDEIEETTEGGIILAVDKTLERAAQKKGTLVAIGETAWKDLGDGEPWAKVGDWVMYAQHAGRTVEDPIAKTTYLMLNDKDLVAVIERPTKEETSDS